MKGILTLICIGFMLLLSTVTRAETPLTVILEKSMHTTYLPIVIANEKAYFKHEGLRVTLDDRNVTSNVILKKLSANNAIAVVSETTYLTQFQKNPAVKQIGSLLDESRAGLISLRSAPIRSVNDLNNKTIGVINDPLAPLFIKKIQDKARALGNNTFKVVMIDHQDATLLKEHKVDGILTLNRNNIINQLELAEIGIHILLPDKLGIPNYDDLIFITQATQANRPAVRAFLKAMHDSVQYLDTSPDAAMSLFFKAYPSLDSRFNRKMAFDTLPYFSENPNEINTQSQQQLANYLTHYTS